MGEENPMDNSPFQQDFTPSWAKDLQNSPYTRQNEEAIRREHERFDIAAGTFAGYLAAQAVQRHFDGQQQAPDYPDQQLNIPTLSLEEIHRREEQRSRETKVRLAGLVAIVFGALLIFAIGGWFGTIGVLVGILGISALIWGGR